MQSLVVAWAQVRGKFTLHAIGPHVITGDALEHVGPRQTRFPTRCANSNVLADVLLQVVINEASVTDVLVILPPAGPTLGTLPAISAEKLWRMH